MILGAVGHNIMMLNGGQVGSLLLKKSVVQFLHHVLYTLSAVYMPFISIIYYLLIKYIKFRYSYAVTGVVLTDHIILH